MSKNITEPSKACEAVTLSGYRTGQQCPNRRLVEINGKALCLRHSGAEALALALKSGAAKKIPTPLPDPYQFVTTIKRK